MIPASREDFKEYCLRRLGKGAIDINVTDEQLEDRIDQALLYLQDYHYEFSEKTYYKYQITQTDIDNEYISLPPNILGAINIFPLSSIVNSQNIFDIRYQIALNDLYTLTSVSMVPYFIAFQQIQFLEEILVGQQPIRFTRHTGKLYVDMDWNKFSVGEYLVVEAYMIIDPEQYTSLWSDRFFADYTTCLFKLSWGENLSKYNGMKMPGGIEFNGQRIKDEATEEKIRLERQMINTYSIPVNFLMG